MNASSGELEEYRTRLREWLEQNLPQRGPGAASNHDPESSAARELQRRIYDAGYIGITLPVDYGGQGLTAEHERIWYQESAAYVVPIPCGVSTLVTLGIVLPTVLAHGSEEQRRQWIPKMLRGDESWAQLLSEPEAGSDLAGLRTRADKDGDIWILNGAKVWSSGALVADFGICLARTDWNVPKHRGLTWFKVPLVDERVTIRAIKEINGRTDFCEEFLDDVQLGDDMVIGEVNGGWPIANTLLAYERAGGSGGAHGIRGGGHGHGRGGARERPEPHVAPDLETLVELRGLASDPATRQLIATAHTEDCMQALLTDRVMATMAAGGANPSVPSLVKLGIGTVNPLRAQIAMEIAGRTGLAWESEVDPGGTAAVNYLSGRTMSIGGGSNEIQRNIISERILGLPREPSFDTDKPFRDVLRDAQTWQASQG